MPSCLYIAGRDEDSIVRSAVDQAPGAPGPLKTWPAGARPMWVLILELAR
jgi:hypothetical protein